MMKFGPGKWTVIPTPRPNARIRLLCFHHAGGGAFGYRDWAACLNAEVELVAVQLPGRENRFSEPPCGSVDEILDALAPILGAQLGVDYAIFGHSLGATLAYLLARRIARTREMPAPTRLIVSGAAPPIRRCPDDPVRPPLTDVELVERLRQFGGTPEVVLDNAAMMAAFLPTMRADFELVASCAPIEERRLDVPITALRGDEDKAVDPEAFARWTALSSHPSQVHLLPGGHFYFRTAPAATFDVLNTVLAADLLQLIRIPSQIHEPNSPRDL
ncbi:MAG TPA: alpha/beta fold hydrolase [Rhizomicrobium sp.]